MIEKSTFQKIVKKEHKKGLTFQKTFAIIYQTLRGVAQLVARSVRDAEVVGSNPVASTKNP